MTPLSLFLPKIGNYFCSVWQFSLKCYGFFKTKALGPSHLSSLACTDEKQIPSLVRNVIVVSIQRTSQELQDFYFQLLLSGSAVLRGKNNKKKTFVLVCFVFILQKPVQITCHLRLSHFTEWDIPVHLCFNTWA